MEDFGDLMDTFTTQLGEASKIADLPAVERNK